MIAPGAIVKIRSPLLRELNGDDTAWVVERQEPDGRWRVCCKAVDRQGRAIFSGRTASEGHLVLVAPPRVYQAGETVERNGLSYAVARDLGDAVELVAPTTRRPLKGGGALHIPGGNTPRSQRAILCWRL